MRISKVQSRPVQFEFRSQNAKLSKQKNSMWIRFSRTIKLISIIQMLFCIDGFAFCFRSSNWKSTLKFFRGQRLAYVFGFNSNGILLLGPVRPVEPIVPSLDKLYDNLLIG